MISPTTHLLAILCVAMIATGQVLFKGAAQALATGGTPLDGRVLGFTVVALVIYAVATVLWILLLRDAALSRLYPYMALSFVMVAVGKPAGLQRTHHDWPPPWARPDRRGHRADRHIVSS